MYQTAAELRTAVPALASETVYLTANLEALIAEFERVAEDYRGVAFEVRNVVESFAAPRTAPNISLRHTCIRSLSSLTVDGTTISSDDYFLNKRLGLITYPVTEGQDIVATYTHGFGFRRVTDGVLNTTTTVTSATAAFTDDDIGEPISGTGIPSGARIVSRNSATSVVISAAATATASSVALKVAANDIVLRACRLYVRSCAMADNSTVPRDVITQADGSGGYTRYSTPDKNAGRPTGYIEVDRLLNSLPDYRLGFA